MHLMVYVSEYTGDEANIDTELSRITDVAKERNQQLGITGVLFYHNGLFMQIIEGEHENLRKLMDDIKDDPRHTNIEMLVDQPIETRDFPRWNMDSFNLSDTQHIDIDELKVIREAFSKNMTMHSGMLVTFYKAMLKGRDLADETGQ